MDFAFDPSKLSKVAADDYSTSDSDSDEPDAAYQKPSTDPAADDDYGEFNPRKRRRTGRNGKEKAALGIFASDSEDERAGRGGRGGKRRQPLRQQGVSFVSSGAKTRGEDEDEDDDDDDDDDDDENDDEYGEFKEPSKKRKEADGEDDDEDDYDEDDTGGVGLGFSAASSSRSQGLGFVPASFASSRQQKAGAAPPPSSSSAYSASNPLGNGFVPSSAYEPVLKAPLEPEKPAVTPKPSAFSSRGHGSGRGRGTGAGPNPNSFGARMMAKMGYVPGQGLGKEGHGRNIIIEANLRPQGVGLGAVREKSDKERQEEKRQARLRGEAVEDSEEEAQKAKKAAAAARRKRATGVGSGGVLGSGSGTSTPRRPKKTQYLTADEVQKAAPGLHIPAAFTPILDMTGPDQKLLTSASGLMTPTGGAATTPGTATTTAADETADQAASQKLVRRARADVMAVLEEWQSLQNRKAYADLQAQQEKQALAELELRLQGHTAMLSAFQQLQGPVAGGDDDDDDDEPMADDDDDDDNDRARRAWRRQWDRTIARLQEAAAAIPAMARGEMRETVANISVAAIHPLVRQALAWWDPLKDPNQAMVDGLRAIGPLLGIGGGEDDGDADAVQVGNDPLYARHHHRKTAAASPYEVLVYRVWLPHVSAAVRQRWDAVGDADSVLALYEAWRAVLPGFVRAQLLEQDVVRQLDAAVARWEPKRRRREKKGQQLLPHLWLFPWLPYLPARHVDPRSADGLVAEVKRKFRQLVDVWEFYRGVVPGLRQWKAVLRPGGVVDTAQTDQWRPMVLSHVLPAMARYVRAQFRVDAADQAPYLEVVTGEFQWLRDDLVAAELVGEVMVSEVFPMWHEALYGLLTAPRDTDDDDDDRLDRIAQWFQWWAEEVFPPALQRLPSVRAEFARGLVLVNEALDCCRADGRGGVVYDAARVRAHLAPPQKGPALSSSHHRHHQHHHHHDHHHGHHHRESKPVPVPPDEPEMTIRHYVEEWCESHDLQFMPERRKVHAEGPLYRITARGDGKGGVLAYFKGVRLYAETKQGAVEVRVDRAEDWEKLLAMAS